MALGSLSLSSSAATVAVDKATSDLLMSPDWTINMDICDNINSRLWQAKDVIKVVKKRLQHKSFRVQLLSLTLLETLVKNCGDYVHFQIADRNILGEMVKIVKKKADMQVRDKILVLLDAWQEAFGGPGGKYPQYYWAYDELRRSGVEFPKRSSDAVPIFTPAATRPTLTHNQAGYGMPSNSSRRLDETMATEIESLTLSSLDSMRDVLDLLNDMLQAVNPGDREAVKDEVIVDLVNRCRANQKKLMQMLTTTGDEDLLGRGLELNDCLQILLAKHDAIASGSPLPSQIANSSPQQSEACSSSGKSIEARDSGPKPITGPSTPSSTVTRVPIDEEGEEEEEDDEFAQLARRHTRTASIPPNDRAPGTNGVGMQCSIAETSPGPWEPTAGPCSALALPDPPAAVKTSKEQNMIDLLSLALTTTSVSPQTPPTSDQNVGEVPSFHVSPQENFHAPSPSSSQGNLHASSQGQAYYNNYVVPWAQPQAPMQVQTLPRAQRQVQTQPWAQPQTQSQVQMQYPRQSSSYPPPPWAESSYPNSHPSYSTYSNNQNHLSSNNMPFTSQASPSYPNSQPSMQAARPSQHSNSFPSMPMPINSSMMTSSPKYPTPAPGSAPAQKPFVPSYRLFEDLNVLGNADRNLKSSSSSSTSISGSPGQGMVGGKK